MLRQLRSIDVQLSIDDFGTGYSSLSYLHRFPINILKIDRSFVSRMCLENESLGIVETIAILASKLKMQVVAEGVETAEQQGRLREIGRVKRVTTCRVGSLEQVGYVERCS